MDQYLGREALVVIESLLMLPRIHLRWVVAISLLCGTAHPAFADGVPIDGWGAFFAEFAVAILVAIVLVILLVRAIIAAKRTRGARPTASAVPEARIVQDRSKPS